MANLPILVFAVLLASVLAQESDIDAFIEEVMRCADIPGLTLTVIRENEDWIAKGYGVRDIVTNEPVNRNTIFVLASTSKAFTGVSLAIVLKNTEGVDFQTPIRDILGNSFYLRDGTRSAQVQLRDAIAHRTGLPRNDDMRIAGWNLTEFVDRLQYLEYTYDFRDRYRYNSIMYSIPALVAETLDGRTWTQIVQDEIYTPLGMVSSTFVSDRSRWNDFATGYFVDNGQNREVSLEVPEAYMSVAPTSGAVSTNALDMQQWIKFQLNEGTTEDGTEILTATEFRETHRALIQRTASPDFERPDDPVTFAPPSRYSLGWQETTYRDYEIHIHTGSTSGYHSLVVLVPSLNHGIYIGLNKSPDNFARDVIAMYILDILLGEDRWLNVNNVCDIMNSKQSNTETNKRTYSRKPVKRAINETTILNEDYTGSYENHAYGTVNVIDEGGNLYLTYGRNSWTWDLTQDVSDPDTFYGEGREPFWFFDLEVQFERSGTDPASSLTMLSFDGEIPPVFERDLGSPPPPPTPCV